MKKLIYGTLFFILISFAAQSISHFGINADHYSTIPFMRTEPIFILGILTMIIQGLSLSYLYNLFSKNDFTVKNGALFGLLITALFVSYPALVEPAKYVVPSVSSWILVEGMVGTFQYTIYGVALSLSFKKLKN